MADTQMIEQLEAEQSMFVQTAHGITSDGKTLVLEGVTPSTLYFSDRPQRVVGHMMTSDFVNLWARETTASRRIRRTPCWRSSNPAMTRLRTRSS
jgi:hypothetical protein